MLTGSQARLAGTIGAPPEEHPKPVAELEQPAVLGLGEGRRRYRLPIHIVTRYTFDHATPHLAATDHAAGRARRRSRRPRRARRLGAGEVDRRPHQRVAVRDLRVGSPLDERSRPVTEDRDRRRRRRPRGGADRQVEPGHQGTRHPRGDGVGSGAAEQGGAAHRHRQTHLGGDRHRDRRPVRRRGPHHRHRRIARLAARPGGPRCRLRSARSCSPAGRREAWRPPSAPRWPRSCSPSSCSSSSSPPGPSSHWPSRWRVAGGIHAALFGSGPLFAVPDHAFAGLVRTPALRAARHRLRAARRGDQPRALPGGSRVSDVSPSVSSGTRPSGRSASPWWAWRCPRCSASATTPSRRSSPAGSPPGRWRCSAGRRCWPGGWRWGRARPGGTLAPVLLISACLRQLCSGRPSSPLFPGVAA